MGCTYNYNGKDFDSKDSVLEQMIKDFRAEVVDFGSKSFEEAFLDWSGAKDVGENQQPSSSVDFNPTNVSEDKRNLRKEEVIKDLGNPTSITKTTDGYNVEFKDGFVLETTPVGIKVPEMTDKFLGITKKDPSYDINYFVGLNKIIEESQQQPSSSEPAKSKKNKFSSPSEQGPLGQEPFFDNDNGGGEMSASTFEKISNIIDSKEISEKVESEKEKIEKKDSNETTKKVKTKSKFSFGSNPDFSQEGPGTGDEAKLIEKINKEISGKTETKTEAKIEEAGEPKKTKVRKKRGEGIKPSHQKEVVDKKSYSTFQEKREKSTIEAEKARLNKILPGITTKVYNGLIQIPGGFAEGYYVDGMIALSDEASIGTAYHEGFHAVSRGILSAKERDSLYKETRKRLKRTKASDLSMEEALAEEFRDYMLKYETLEKSPKWKKMLFELMEKLVSLFKKNDRIFRNIRKGKYEYPKTISPTNDIFYSEVRMPEKYKKEFVDAIAYHAVNNSGTFGSDSSSRDQITKAHYDVARKNIENAAYKLDKKIDSVKTKAEEEAILDQLEFYDQLLENDDVWDLFSSEAEAKIKSYGLKSSMYDEDITDEKAEDEGNVNGEQYENNAYNQDVVTKATQNTKLLIATLQDRSSLTELGLPKLVDQRKAWRTLLDNISGTVSKVNPVKSINDKLMELKDNKNFKDLGFDQLYDYMTTEDPATQFKRQQFYLTMSGQSIDYINTIMDQKINYDDNGNMTVSYSVSVGNADVASIANQIRDENISSVAKKVGKKGFSENVDKIAKQFVGSKFDHINLKDLSNNLKAIGFNVSEQNLLDFVSKHKSKHSALKRLSYALSPSDISKGYSLKRLAKEGVFDEEANFLNKNVGYIGGLFKMMAYSSDKVGGSMVLGPDGKMFYTVSLNNFATKNLALWKSESLNQNNEKEGILEINKMLSKQYHRKSLFLNEFSDNPDSLKDFHLQAYLMQKVDGQYSDDIGRKYSELQPTDDIIERINRTVMGVATSNESTLFPLTLADKSMAYTMTAGPLMKAFGKNKSFGGASKRAVKVMKNYFLAEAERIVAEGLYENNREFNDRKMKSFWFPSLSPESDYAKENKIWTEKDGKLSLNKDNPAIDSLIKETLEKEIAAEEAILREKGIIDKKGNLVGISEDIVNSKEYKGKGKNLIADYVIYSMIGNIEYTMLFAGDPAFYKDLPKRIASTIATGTDAIYSEERDKNFNIAVVKDIEGSKLHGNYKNAFEEIKDKNGKRKFTDDEISIILEPYLKQEQGDGMAYITPARLESILRMEGKLDKTLKDAISRLTKDKYPGDNVQMIEDMDAVSESFANFQSLKGMHYQLRDVGDQAVPTYLKYSQAVLWPSLVKNTPLERVYKSMVSNKKMVDGKAIDSPIDELVFKSAIKAGAGKVTDISRFMDPSAEIDESIQFEEEIELSNFYWKRQQDLPSKYQKKGYIQRGSQAPNNIIANITGKAINVRGMSSTEGRDVAKHYQALEAQLSDFGLHGFKAGMKATNGKSELQMIAEDLLEEAIAKESDSNTINQLKDVAEGRIIAPLDVIATAGKLESELLSRLTKATVKMNVKGGAFIQVANVGMESLTQISPDTIADMSGLIMLNEGKELQGPRKVNGKTVPGDIFLPYRFFEKLPRNIQSELSEGKITIEDLKKYLGDSVEGLIGFRIPNQAMSSNDVLNVAGILPKHAGDTMMTYTEVPGKTGADFDIDKMFIMTPHLKWNNKDQKLEKIKYDTETSDEAIAERFNVKVQEIHSKSKAYKEFKAAMKSLGNLDEERSKMVEDYLDQGGIESENIDEELTELMSDNLGDIIHLKKLISKLQEDLKGEVSDYFVSNGVRNIKEFGEKPLEFQNSVKQLENRRLEVSEAILLSADNFEELVTPLDADNLKVDAYYLSFLNEMSKGSVSLSQVNEDITIDNIEKYKEDIADWMKKNEGKMSDLQFASARHQLKVKVQNMSGKAGIGQTANHMTHIAQAQLAGLKSLYDIGIGITDDDGSTRYDIDQNTADRLITMEMSAWLNAYVDNAKDPYITLINNNIKTANSVFAMLRAGVPMETVNRIVTQPIVRDYIENMLDNDSVIVGAQKTDEEYYDIAFNSESDEFSSFKNVSGKVSPMAKTLQKWGVDLTQEIPIETANLRKLSDSDLEKMIMKGDGDQADPNEQIPVLMSFIKIMGHSKDLNEVVKASKQNTRGAFQSAAENMIAKDLVGRVKHISFPMQNVHGLFEIDGQDTVLGAMTRNSLESAESIMKDKLMSFTPKIKTTIEHILDISGNNNLDPKFIKKVTNSHRAYEISNTEMFNDPFSNGMFVGSNTMSDRVSALKDKEGLYNRFVNQLIPVKGKIDKKTKKKAPDFVKLPSSTQRTKYETDELIQGWRDLINSEDKLESKLGKDLIKYSFFASGMSKNLNSFYDLIPHEMFNEQLGDESITYYEQMNEVMKTLQEGEVNEHFVDQLARHNADDESIVKSIPRKNKDLKVLGNKVTISVDKLRKRSNSKFNRGTESHPAPVMYISKNNKGKRTIYKLSNATDKQYFYEKIPTLGYAEKGNYIYEYSKDEKMSLRSNFYSKQNTTSGKNDLGSLVRTDEINVRTFKNRPDVSLVLEGTDGSYSVFLEGHGKRIEITTDDFKINDIDQAFKEGVAQLGNKDVDQILSSC